MVDEEPFAVFGIRIFEGSARGFRTTAARLSRKVIEHYELLCIHVEQDRRIMRLR